MWWHFQECILRWNKLLTKIIKSFIILFYFLSQDFVSKLPGINTTNIYSVLNKVSSLPELLTLSKEKLTEILGSSTNAEALHNSLHHCIKPPDQLQDTKRGGKFTKKGRRRFQTRFTWWTIVTLINKILIFILSW